MVAGIKAIIPLCSCTGAAKHSPGERRAVRALLSSCSDWVATTCKSLPHSSQRMMAALTRCGGSAPDSRQGRHSFTPALQKIVVMVVAIRRLLWPRIMVLLPKMRRRRKPIRQSCVLSSKEYYLTTLLQKQCPVAFSNTGACRWYKPESVNNEAAKTYLEASEGHPCPFRQLCPPSHSHLRTPLTTPPILPPLQAPLEHW